MRNVIGDNLKRIRQLRGIDRVDVAEKLGVSIKTIGNWERGDRDPSSADILKLAKIYDVPTAELVGHIDSPIDNRFLYIIPDGDISMSPEIIPGDELTISKIEKPKDGDLVLIESPHHDGLIRRLYHYGKMLSLLAVNSSVAPITGQPDSVSIKGKVIELKRKV